MTDKELLQRAIDLAVDNVKHGGGPFGAVIARNGEIIAEGVNRVTANNDPTAHAEVQTIRAATAQLHTFDLTGCTIYSSCEPCPMCLGAIYWAHLDRLLFAGTKVDAAQAGFDDDFIYKEMELPFAERRLITQPVMHEEGKAPFVAWELQTDRTDY